MEVIGVNHQLHLGTITEEDLRGEEVIINSIHGKQNRQEEILGETQEDLGVDLLAGVVVVILEDPGEVVIQIMEEKKLIDRNK